MPGVGCYTPPPFAEPVWSDIKFLRHTTPGETGCLLEAHKTILEIVWEGSV